MTKTIAQTYTTIHTYRVLIMRLLIAGCVLSTLWYGINVYNAISRTIVAEKISNQASILGNSVNDLGSQYIKLSHVASPSALDSYGMSFGKVTAYIPRTSTYGSVALLSHEF